MKIVIFGAGSFGTALAHQIAKNGDYEVTLLLRDPKISEGINVLNVNSKYYPNRKLNERIQATNDPETLKNADVVFLAIPSRSLENSIKEFSGLINKKALLVNVAKGMTNQGGTLVQFLKKELKHENTITLKGASFGAELINGVPTLLTVGFKETWQLNLLREIFDNTSIYLDYTTDIKGVELLSALKNVYAILLGRIDGQYNSANTRFMFLTKAIAELKAILVSLGGDERTLFLSCGIGDMSLTGLTDLSRNRTLGLLIAKGFYSTSVKNSGVVLEGINTLKCTNMLIPETLKRKLPLFEEMMSYFLKGEGSKLEGDFKNLFRKPLKTVLTYGTFDLLHYGHLELLRRIREIGDRVIVGLSTDKFNEIKGKKCVMPYEKRRQLLEVLDYVDLVIPEENWQQKSKDIKKFEVDTFVMGDDWRGKFDYLREYCEVVYLPRTKGISTTKLKSILEIEN